MFVLSFVLFSIGFFSGNHVWLFVFFLCFLRYSFLCLCLVVCGFFLCVFFAVFFFACLFASLCFFLCFHVF